MLTSKELIEQGYHEARTSFGNIKSEHYVYRTSGWRIDGDGVRHLEGVHIDGVLTDISKRYWVDPL